MPQVRLFLPRLPRRCSRRKMKAMMIATIMTDHRSWLPVPVT
jgi:hypothetical protein